MNAKIFLCLSLALSVKVRAFEPLTNSPSQALAHHWEYITFPDDIAHPNFLMGWPSRGDHPEELSRGLSLRVLNVVQGFQFCKTNGISARLYRTNGEVVEPTAEGKKLLRSPGAANGDPPQVGTYFPWGPNRLGESWIEVSMAAERYWLEIPYGFDRNPSEPLPSAVENGPPSFAPFVRSWTKHDHLVPWETVHYRLGRAQDGADLSLIQSNPCEAKGVVELYRFPQAQNLYSPRTNLRLLDSDGTVINGNCVNLHLDDSHLRRTDTFQVVAWGTTDSRCWGQIEVMVDDNPYRVVIPSSLYKYAHGHVSRTGTNAGFNVDQLRPGGQLDDRRSQRSNQREISGTGTMVQSHSEASSDEQTVYRNRRYGLKFSLPATWRGYSAISTEWEGRAFVAAVDGLEVIERGPMIVLRHPNWRTGNRYQDIPIMVFTRGQWDACRQGKFAIGAGGVEYEIAHNSTYVFAISSRFNADETLKGWKKASDAVEHNRIANAPHLYPW